MIDQARLAAEAMARLVGVTPAPDAVFRHQKPRQDPEGLFRVTFDGPKKLLKEPTTRAPSYAYTRIAARATADHRLGGAAKGLLALLLMYARNRGSCDGFIDQFADELSVSGRTIQRAQARLERLGYIRIERRRYGRINDANLYHLTDKAIPPASAPRRRRGGDKKVTPRTLATQAEGSSSERSQEMLSGAALPAAPHPRRSAPPPPRSVRGGGLLAENEPQVPCQAGQIATRPRSTSKSGCSHPPPNSS